LPDELDHDCLVDDRLGVPHLGGSAWADLVHETLSVGQPALFHGGGGDGGSGRGELWMMRAGTPEQFATALRWLHVPAWALVVALVGFVRLYLRAGRRWLAWTIGGVRTLSLILNFLTGPNLNYREITALRRIPFLGEPVSVGVGVSNPWMLVGQLSLVLLVVFVVDAAFKVWRRGDRRQALVLGGGIVFFVSMATGQAILALWGIVPMPITASLFYMGIIAAMGFELSHDVLRAAEISEDLRESEQRMDLAARAAGLGMWVWNIARNEIWITDKARALFGFTPSEKLDAERFRSRIHPEDRESVLRARTQSIESGGAYESEYRIMLPDGEVRWLAGCGRAEFNGEGKAVFMRGASRDITRRKLGEEALRESEARFRTVANTAPVMIWMSGTDKLCTFFNKGWLDFTGRTSEQELGNGWAEGVHREDFNRCLEVYANSFDARQPFTMEYRLRRSDGEYRWILDSGTPRFASDGAFLGFIGSCIDISERKLAELDAQRHRTELAHLSRVALMGEMSASLAHELNQPLTGIVSNAAAGQRFIDTGHVTLPELRELLADISADGRRAGDVVRGIRNMVKKGETVRQQINLNDVVMNVVQIVQPDALLRSCEVKTSLEQNLPAIEGDPIQLQQVLLNLVINAFDAMRDAPVVNRKVEITTAWNGNGAIRTSVRDYGVGISEEARERLFDPFFTTKAEGLGMGLAIVRSIVESHAGTMAAENAEGGGALFHFTLSANVPASG
jgi:two-component system, LuxR family, sensor kinase FixL